jgi:ketosteroid isomerase-like protein
MADNSEIISGAYAAFARGDVPAVLGVFDPKIEWRDADGFPNGGTYIGSDAVLNGVFMPLVADWDGFTVAADELVSNGDRVIALGHYTGTNKKTGKSIDVPFAHAWRFKDGKATHFQQYTDTYLVQEAMK